MKNKILKYDCLIVGSGLLGSLLGIALIKKKYKILIIEKENLSNRAFSDQRTLAVNANSRDFLQSINLWEKLNNQFTNIDQISIKTFLNSDELVFKEQQESMGSVIYNKELLAIAHKFLISQKSIIDKTLINLDQLTANENIQIQNKNYSFKKIIIAGGKQFREQMDPYCFLDGSSSQKAHVGFFNHQKSHDNIAYENFTKQGPLAILPAPHKSEKFSTFIYSTSDLISKPSIEKVISKNFKNTHGNIQLNKNIFSYPINPYLFNPKKKYKDLIFIGDSFRSIHPVAGQGWNLGVKDIQSFLNLLNSKALDSKNFNAIYYSRRKIESYLYFAFTEVINKTFQLHTPLANFFGSNSLKALKRLSFLRTLFIKQAMGINKIIN